MDLYQHELRRSLNLLKCFYGYTTLHIPIQEQYVKQLRIVKKLKEQNGLEIMVADCPERLLGLPDGLAQTGITSMPYITADATTASEPRPIRAA